MADADETPFDRFVGRTALRRAMAASVPAPGGSGSLWLISGPPGIGKTRLAREVTDEAGVRTVWGRSWDGGGAPALWPWTQAVRSLIGTAGATSLDTLVLEDEPARDRFTLFDATVTHVRSAAEREPLVIVLDDLHDADEATLLLARFMAKQLDELPVLLVLATRPPEPESAAAEHLTALARFGDRVELPGLATAEIAELTGRPERAGNVRAITGGNPLLVRNVIGHGLGITGSAGSDPDEALRAVVASRLAACTRTQRTTLAAAALLGGDADTDAIATVAGEPTDRVWTALRSLHDDGLAVHISDAVAPSHALFGAEALAGVPAGQRETMHRRAADLTQVAERPQTRAHHLLHAGDQYRDEALDACEAAAADALAAQAPEDAAAILEQAVGKATDPRREFDLRIALGRAYWRSTDGDRSAAAFDRAWEIAERLDEPEYYALAALGGGITYVYTPLVAERRAERDRAAISRFPAEDSVLRARLLASLATKRGYVAHLAEGRRLAAEALAMARRLGDDYAIGHALVAEQVTNLGPDSLSRRLETAHELLALAQRSGIHDLEMHGRYLLMGALLESGDIRGLDTVLAAHSEVVDRLAEPRFARFAVVFWCMRAVFDGRPDQAERLAYECYELSELVDDAADGSGMLAAQLAVLHWVRGTLSASEDFFAERRRLEPDEPMWIALLAYSLASRGQTDAAQGMLDAAPAVADLPDTMHWLITTAMMADAAVLVGDLDRCKELRDALLPYAARIVPISQGAAPWTVVARPLGRVSVALGLVDEGVHHLEHAIDVAARVGAMPWLVEAQVDLAETYAAHRPADPRARPLAEDARAHADRLAMAWLADRADRVAADLPDPVSAALPGPGGRTSDAMEPPSVAVLGSFEVIGADGGIATWKSRKARELLKLLVARRGGPLHREEAMDTLWPDEDPAALQNRLSVALSTIRRALDPERQHPAGAFIDADRSVIRLRLDRVSVDTEIFLDSARAAGSLGEHRAALWLFRGEALADEPYADWATGLRDEVNATVGRLARTVATRCEDADDHVGASEAYRRLLEVDPYDESGHLGYVRSLEAMGARGHAKRAYEIYQNRCAELGVEPAARPA